MKIGFTLAMIFATQLTFAQTLKEKKVKEEMMGRVETLITKAEEGREALDKEDVLSACQKIDEIFKILPDHLVAIGTKMDMYDSKIATIEQETKLLLIDMHQRSNACAEGERGENLDIGETDKKLKSMVKLLKKQKKRIKKSDTDFNNSYQYRYEL